MKNKIDKGVLKYFSVKNRKKVKALIRELGLELVIETIVNDTPGNWPGVLYNALHRWPLSPFFFYFAFTFLFSDLESK